MDLLWAGKNPRIKMKVQCDVKERDLQLPNLRIYHEAVCLLRLRDWVTLSNQKMLNYGWHVYFWYEKHKIDGLFL